MDSARRGTSSSARHITKHHHHVGNGTFRCMLFVLCAFVVAGVLFCILAVPPHPNSGGRHIPPGFAAAKRMVLSGARPYRYDPAADNGQGNEQGNVDAGASLAQKVSHWLGVDMQGASAPLPHVDRGLLPVNEPDWSQTFWSPVDISVSGPNPEDVMVTLCKLDWHTYTQSPHIYPMNKDLISLSGCRGSNYKSRPMNVLLQEMEQHAGDPEGRWIEPTGFVFHESRVGSTLVANVNLCLFIRSGLLVNNRFTNRHLQVTHSPWFIRSPRHHRMR
jgi:hypothetical protein